MNVLPGIWRLNSTVSWRAIARTDVTAPARSHQAVEPRASFIARRTSRANTATHASAGTISVANTKFRATYATPSETTAGNSTSDPTPRDQDTITEMQGRKLWAIARREKWTEARLRTWLKDVWGYDSIKAIRKSQFDEVMQQLQHTKGGPDAPDVLESEIF